MMVNDDVSVHSRAFSRCGRGIGLGGMDLPLALARNRGICDQLFEARATQFREGPRLAIGIKLKASACDLDLLENIYARYLRRDLPGAPAPFSGGLASLSDWRQLVPLAPTYRLPACDAVSVADAVLLLNYLSALCPSDASNLLYFGARWLSSDPGARPTALTPTMKSARGCVTDDAVAKFAEQFRVLRRMLLDAIPWERFGASMCQDAQTANAIASDILGIPVDLRVGGLVLEESVVAVTRLAGGNLDDRIQERHLRAIISQTVPKVRKRAARPGLPTGIVTATRGAVWSVALDAAVNNPLIWGRDQQGVLSRVRPAGPPERPVLAHLPSTIAAPDVSTALSEHPCASASRLN